MTFGSVLCPLFSQHNSISSNNLWDGNSNLQKSQRCLFPWYSRSLFTWSIGLTHPQTCSSKGNSSMENHEESPPFPCCQEEAPEKIRIIAIKCMDEHCCCQHQLSPRCHIFLVVKFCVTFTNSTNCSFPGYLQSVGWFGAFATLPAGMLVAHTSQLLPLCLCLGALPSLSDPFWKVSSVPWWLKWLQQSWEMNYILLNVMLKCSGTDAQPISSF